MSFDLSVWRPKSAPITTADAEREHRALCDRETGETPGPEIATFLRDLMERYPDLDMSTVDNSPWTARLATTETSVVMCTAGDAAADVFAFVRPLAARHGLVLFDPNRGFVHNPGAPAVTMTLSDGYEVGDPDPARLEECVRQLEHPKAFLILDRGGEHYVQAIHGGAAKRRRPAWYALERRGGSAERHYRCVVHELDELVAAFRAFAGGTPDWTDAFAWEKVDL